MESNTINLSSDKEEMKLKSLSAIEERLVSILKEGPQTRDQLVKKMHLPRTTIYDGCRNLIKRNEVKKFPLFATERSRGRPQVLFSLFDGKE
jgi:predicted ArsR family transcriptional regulator